jgi:hypothetical protein
MFFGALNCDEAVIRVGIFLLEERCINLMVHKHQDFLRLTCLKVKCDVGSNPKRVRHGGILPLWGCAHPCPRYVLDCLPEVLHMDLFAGVKKLILKERAAHVQEIAKLDAAMTALNGAGHGAKSQHTMSAAGRKRISLAQKKRWAKQNARPKRTISAAGRRRIAAAQRARWAKVKKNKAA